MYAQPYCSFPEGWVFCEGEACPAIPPSASRRVPDTQQVGSRDWPVGHGPEPHECLLCCPPGQPLNIPRGLSARPWARRGTQLCPQGAEPGEGEKRKLKENIRWCLSIGGSLGWVWGCLSTTKTLTQPSCSGRVSKRRNI